MIVKPELVKRIKEYFNLNIYETKVWLALLSKGIASAKEVADLSGVPRSRTYDVLESLEKRGFAITKVGKPVKYISVKPVEVIEKMKNETIQEAQEKVKSLSTLKETSEYTELQQLHSVGISPIKTADITGSLKGRANVVSRLRELIECAEKEVLLCTSVLDFEDKSRVLLPALEQAAKDNIKIVEDNFAEFWQGLQIAEKYGIDPTDGIILSMMLKHGVSEIYSNDSDFDKIPGIKRVF